MKVLFVCTGNICRSPTAEAVFRHRAAEAGLTVEADSAGTQGWHVGAAPDERSQRIAAARGYDLSGQRARAVRAGDFAAFDLLLGMDRSHAAALRRQAPDGTRSRVRLLLDFAPSIDHRDVPDPYYGGRTAFERTLDLIEAGVDGLVAALKNGVAPRG